MLVAVLQSNPIGSRSCQVGTQRWTTSRVQDFAQRGCKFYQFWGMSRYYPYRTVHHSAMLALGNSTMYCCHLLAQVCAT